MRTSAPNDRGHSYRAGFLLLGSMISGGTEDSLTYDGLVNECSTLKFLSSLYPSSAYAHAKSGLVSR